MNHISGWWFLKHGWIIFHFIIIWVVILPIDELNSIIFQRGRYTTNQILYDIPSGNLT